MRLQLMPRDYCKLNYCEVLCTETVKTNLRLLLRNVGGITIERALVIWGTLLKLGQ